MSLADKLDAKLRPLLENNTINQYGVQYLVRSAGGADWRDISERSQLPLSDYEVNSYGIVRFATEESARVVARHLLQQMEVGGVRITSDSGRVTAGHGHLGQAQLNIIAQKVKSGVEPAFGTSSVNGYAVSHSWPKPNREPEI